MSRSTKYPYIRETRILPFNNKKRCKIHPDKLAKANVHIATTWTKGDDVVLNLCATCTNQTADIILSQYHATRAQPK